MIKDLVFWARFDAKRPIRANPGLKYNFVRFCVLPSYVNYLEQHFVLPLLHPSESRAQQHFVSSSCIPSLEEPGPGLLKCPVEEVN